jgi:hypothetical protein
MKWDVTFHLNLVYHRVPWKLSPAFKKTGLGRSFTSLLTIVAIRAMPPKHVSSWPSKHVPDDELTCSNRAWKSLIWIIDISNNSFLLRFVTRPQTCWHRIEKTMARHKKKTFRFKSTNILHVLVWTSCSLTQLFAAIFSPQLRPTDCGFVLWRDYM